jgi:hypothetical protein
MTEQTTDQTQDQLTDDQKQALAEQDRLARIWAKAQSEETEKAHVAQQWNNLGSMNSQAFREFVRRQAGYDPGC